MRLLNTRILQLTEFSDADTPSYAILSHTWERDEIMYQDIEQLDIAKRKAGWRKVERACAHARKHYFEWIWIDSCCINKESSAELSEAINSMYQYYLDAEVCYVYLSDVFGVEDPRDAGSTFRRSRWFKRGWTLQELLAPPYAVFLNRGWREIGTKWSLRDTISAITSIPSCVLEGGDIEKFSIAQRMSWAALRKTTRSEDQAYCLMGIFGVSMPPLYGEGGTKAFMRLQQEIIKISDDRSIFAWTAPTGEAEPRGLLARSPYEFRASGGIGISESGTIPSNHSSFTFNNNGLHIHTPLVPAPLDSENNLFLASLLCRSERDASSYHSVYLAKTSGGRYVRCRASELPLVSSFTTGTTEELVVSENRPSQKARYRPERISRCHIRLLPLAQRWITFSHHLTFNHSLWPMYIDDMVDFITIVEEEAVGSLTYKTHTADPDQEEDLSIVIKCNLNDIPRFSIVTKAISTLRELGEHLEATGYWEGHPDRMKTPLRNGSVVTLAVHITGKHLILELDYIPSGTSPSVYVTTLPPLLGFIVPTRLPTFKQFDWSFFSLQNVFPLDHFQTEYRDDNRTFISAPDTDAGASVARILTYAFLSNRKTAFVAAGFHGTKIWIDLTVFDHESKPEAEEIWNSYLDGGPRAQVRLENRTSVSGEVYAQIFMTVHVRKRENFHFLEFGWREIKGITS
ncbi:hypothetical protein VKT23_011125 [Stygiomarasmius scandens]|uniref:Heterokaryon incompatibility domain-containing protein n=1 Tax=Marasmiellus scandens TaxID=2682957 RepID=A0ABR1JF37_9AGAR